MFLYISNSGHENVISVEKQMLVTNNVRIAQLSYY